MTIWMPVLDRSKPLYLAIAEAIARDVDGGTLPDGARLPPQRDLAWKLGVTLGTVTRAYKEAENRGLLSGEVGRGSYIRRQSQATPLRHEAMDQNGIVDLSHAIPPPVVASQEFDAALQAISHDPHRLDMLNYAPVDGFAQHKSMAAHWLKHSGMTISEENIVITAGAHVGVMTILNALTTPGDRILAEEVNYALLRNSFRNAHVEAEPLVMDDDGLMPEALEKAARSSKAKLLYLVPSLQNPTTNTMSRRRRDAIVAVARKYDLTIIEDDIFRLLDSRAQAPTFYALAPERTYHVTSLSKTLSPGLRIGIVVTPEGQDRVLKTHLRSMASRNVGLAAEIARHWIETGVAGAILTRTRNELAARRNSFLEIFKGATFRCEPGAPFAWLHVPPPWSSARLAATLASRNVRVTPESAFLLDRERGRSNHIRVCFGGPRSGLQVRQGFELIRTLMKETPEEDFTPVA